MAPTLPIIAPSILAADYTKLGSEIETCLNANVKWIHCDVMDGHFVPNISYGPVVVDAANQFEDAFLDVHLMIKNPGQYIQAFVESGADLLTVHQEACPHLHRTIQQIKQNNVKAGVAINPATPVAQLEGIVEYVDLVLIMSVNPGFGGQHFIESTHQKIKEMSALRSSKKADFLIEVDGGIGPENIQKIAESGADIFVAGSAVFKASDITQSIKTLREKATLPKGSFV